MNPTLVQPNPPFHTTWDTLIGIGIVLAGIGLIWLLNRVILHCFPSSRKRHASIGNALMRVEATFLPGREHIMEALERDDEETDEQADPPQTGNRRCSQGSQPDR